MAKSNVMTVSVIGLNVFPFKITHDGKEYDVQGSSINDAFEELDRARSLLKDLVFNHLDNDVLNAIGLSHEDLSNLSMSSEEDLDNKKIPLRKDWYGE